MVPWKPATYIQLLVIGTLVTIVQAFDSRPLPWKPAYVVNVHQQKMPLSRSSLCRPCGLTKLLSRTRTRKERPSTCKMQQKNSESSTSVRLDKSPWIVFSAAMVFSGAVLGPFLDNYHSAFGVLAYDNPIKWLAGDSTLLTTAWWVPPLFGLAGFIIGWLYIILDSLLSTESAIKSPSGPKILCGISFFACQYWLSGFLADSGQEGAGLFGTMSVLAGIGFVAFDNTVAGAITSLATAVGGPLIEIGLILALAGKGGYHYTAPDFLDLIPLWICPVYFLGGPAVGNLARGIWLSLQSGTGGGADSELGVKAETESPCMVCNDTRAVPCPNCDGIGSYVTYGRNVQCTSCSGRAFVICRTCFDRYGDDPWDIDRIREKMDTMDVEGRRKFLL